MNLNKILEITGIDLIPYAMGFVKFTSNIPFEPTTFSGIKEKVHKISEKKLKGAIEYSKEVLEEETTRGEKVESKAYNLIGLTSISAAFVTGASSLISKETINLFSYPFIIFISLFYIVIVVSLTLTILLASRAVNVRSYTRPNMSDIFLLETRSITELQREQLSTYMYCYLKNSQTHNNKVSYLMGAQLWFRNSVIMFLILAFTIITGTLNYSKDNLNINTIQTLGYTTQTQQTAHLTQTSVPPYVITPTQTKKPTFTVTSVQSPILTAKPSTTKAP